MTSLEMKNQINEMVEALNISYGFDWNTCSNETFKNAPSKSFVNSMSNEDELDWMYSVITELWEEFC